MCKRNLSNSKKKNTSLALGKNKVFVVAVQKDPCLYDKNHRSHKEKNVVQNAWKAVVDELDFVEDGKTFLCYFRYFY